MERGLRWLGGSAKLRRNIESNNDGPNRTADGKIGLKHAFVRSNGVSRELRYVLDHPSAYGIIVANGLQLSGDSRPTKYPHCKGEYQARLLKAQPQISLNMRSSNGLNTFGIWTLPYHSQKMRRSSAGGLAWPMMWEVR